MPKLWLGVSPGAEATRVIALQDNETILKAHLSSVPNHPRALPWLLEAMALWQGTAVRAVLSAGCGVGGPVTSFYRDWFVDFGGPLYSIEWDTGERSRGRRHDRLRYRGDFGDLKQMHIEDLLARGERA